MYKRDEMPRKNQEERNKYQKEKMRKRRAEGKPEKQPEPSEIPPSQPEVEPEPPQPKTALEKRIENYPIFSDPYQTADLTRQLLDGKGWCFWKCSVFHNEIIVIIRDKTVEGYPENFTAYTEAELSELVKVSPHALGLLHQAKKATQGELIPNLT